MSSLLPLRPAFWPRKKRPQRTPIVFASVVDPVASGLVASLARPGGNITGLTILGPELSGKRLELLKEVLPNVTRVAALWNSANPAQELVWKEMQAAAQELRLQLQSLEVRSANDFDIAFKAALRERAGSHSVGRTPHQYAIEAYRGVRS
jgi:ABC-type uncharacterized transport system substrate-binding protein